MDKIILSLARRVIIKKLFEKGYKQSTVNQIMKALELTEVGIPKMLAPPPPKRKGNGIAIMDISGTATAEDLIKLYK